MLHEGDEYTVSDGLLGRNIFSNCVEYMQIEILMINFLKE